MKWRKTSPRILLKTELWQRLLITFLLTFNRVVFSSMHVNVSNSLTSKNVRDVAAPLDAPWRKPSDEDGELDLHEFTNFQANHAS